MKSIINNALFLLTMVLLVTSCKSDDINYSDARVTPVEDLYSPVDNQNVKLQTAAGSTLLFQWPQALSQDMQIVMYEVLFYKESDKENPIYRIASDQQGGAAYANILHRDLNRAANAAGIPPGEIGNLFWTVASSRGLNVALCSKMNTLTIKRLNGFADIPENLYITGSATENGEEVANAIPASLVSEGEYEIYTKLTKGGSYKFVDKKDGTATEYYINPEGELLFAEGDKSSTVANDGVYRITLDFNTGSTTLTEIKSMGMFFCDANSVTMDLPYKGLGVWEGSGKVVFKDQGTWKDERYKFQMETSSGTAQLGTVNGTDSRPGPNDGASYYYVKWIDNVTQWDDKWKFADEMDGADVTISIIMQAGSPFTHVVKKN